MGGVYAGRGQYYIIKERKMITYDLLDIARLTRMAKDYIVSESQPR